MLLQFINSILRSGVLLLILFGEDVALGGVGASELSVSFRLLIGVTDSLRILKLFWLLGEEDKLNADLSE